MPFECIANTLQQQKEIINFHNIVYRMPKSIIFTMQLKEKVLNLFIKFEKLNRKVSTK